MQDIDIIENMTCQIDGLGEAPCYLRERTKVVTHFRYVHVEGKIGPVHIKDGNGMIVRTFNIERSVVVGDNISLLLMDIGGAV